MRYPTLVFLLLSFVPSVVAQVCAPPPAAQLWSDPTTWPNSTPPEPGDDVEIPAGTIRFVDISPPELGEVTVRTFDGEDNLLAETDPLERTTTFTYTPSNDLETQADPLGQGGRHMYRLPESWHWQTEEAS